MKGGIKMEKDLKELQNYMNRDWDMCVMEGYKFNILEMENDNGEAVDNFVLLQIVDADKNELLENYRTKQVFDTLEENITGLISDIYSTDINPKNKIIKNWNTFSSRKVKSLSKAFVKNDAEKIFEINMELVTRLKNMEICKHEVQEYKRFVSLLYRAKNELCNDVEGE